MKSKLRERLTFANVVSVVALLFALGLGSAWAATELGKNSVKSKQIAPGQVMNSDLGNDAVTSPKVADGSLLGSDFAPGQLPQGPPGERGLQGEQGVQGLRGEQGIQGVQGEPGPSRGNFNQCGTANVATVADGAGGGQLGTAECAVTVDAPTAGKLLITASGESNQLGGTTVGVNCPGASAASPNKVGQSVRLSDAGPLVEVRSISDEFGEAAGSHGVAISAGRNVAAGTHTVLYELSFRYGGTCFSGTALNYRFINPSVEAVFVKGAS